MGRSGGFYAGAIVIALFAGQARGQCGGSWTRRATTGPPVRGAAKMAFDSARGVCVLFGGQGDSGNLGDTWEWNGSTWAQRISQSSPSARYGHAMAYDSARHVTVLFGGVSATGTGCFGESNDTWEWDGTNWTQRFPVTVPSTRGGLSMAFDSVRGRCVLPSGFHSDPANNCSQSDLGETWEWDGVNWTYRGTRHPVDGHSVAYDSVRRLTLLVDGWTPLEGYNTGLEAWNGTSWATLVSPTNHREGSGFAFDSIRAVAFRFGGTNNSGPLSDSSEFNGTSWSSVSATGPSVRGYPAMAYDSVRARIVLFGGFTYDIPGNLGDTWEYLGLGPKLAGDMNRDGLLNGNDIRVFISAVMSRSTNSTDRCLADFNANNTIDVGDTPGFVAKLLGN